MADPKYGDIVIPPKKKAEGTPSDNTALNAILKAHPGLEKYRDQIAQAATDYGMGKAQLAAVLAKESGYGAAGKIPHDGGVLGIGQIQDVRARPFNTAPTPVPFFRPENLVISNEDKLNPTFAIKYTAWRISGLLHQGYSLDEAWGGPLSGRREDYIPYAYNNGYWADHDPSKYGVNKIIQKIAPGSVPPVTSQLTPEQIAALNQTQQAANLADTDPYVNSQGRPLWGQVTTPRDSIPSQSGDAMRLSEFTLVSKNFNTIYAPYTNGLSASPAEVAAFAKSPMSQFTLKRALAGLEVGEKDKKGYIPPSPERQKAFLNSPVYKQTAGDYINTYQQIYGLGKKPPVEMLAQAVAEELNQGAFAVRARELPDYTKSQEFQGNAGQLTSAARSVFGPRYTPPAKLIRNAVAEGLSPAAFVDQLRKSPEYVKSNEYQQNFSQSYRAYNQVYGRPDDQGKEVVRQAALNGWTGDQFGQYLRAQPGYTQSPEFQTKALSFLEAMGLITGDTPVLRPGTAPINQDATGAEMARPGQVGPPAPAVPRQPGKTLVAGFASSPSGRKLYG